LYLEGFFEGFHPQRKKERLATNTISSSLGFGIRFLTVLKNVWSTHLPKVSLSFQKYMH